LREGGIVPGRHAVKQKNQKGRERLSKLLGRTKGDSSEGQPPAKAKKRAEEFGRRAASRPRNGRALSAEERMLRAILGRDP
jgi:hypothetical protein